MIEALKARDTARLRASRNALAAFTNELVAQKKKPREILDDDSALGVLRRLAKQRKESIEQFSAGGRDDLVTAEKEELAYLLSYLPQMMNKDEITKIVHAKKKELDINDSSKAGILIGAVMKELRGRADGKDVKEVVDSLLK